MKNFKVSDLLMMAAVVGILVTVALNAYKGSLSQNIGQHEGPNNSWEALETEMMGEMNTPPPEELDVHINVDQWDIASIGETQQVSESAASEVIPQVVDTFTYKGKINPTTLMPINPFNELLDTMETMGKFMALPILLIGIGLGVLQQNIMAAITSVMMALMLSQAPAIIRSIIITG